MRAVVQRVTESRVSVDGEIIGEIGPGLTVLLGVSQNDSEKDAVYLANKIAHLRIFEDDAGKLNRSVIDTRGEMLVISQFTLLGDCRKGRRPSFGDAAGPEKAEALYHCFVKQVRDLGVGVATGRFRAMMEVALVNSGPVTLIVESV